MRAAIAALLLVLACTAPAGAEGAETADATWRPAASERLMRLPAGYLERAIDRDFQDSPLAAALDEAGHALADRNAGLGELQAAVEAATGDARDALRQQFLEEKQAYLQLMGRRHDLERERLKTRLARTSGCWSGCSARARSPTTRRRPAWSRIGRPRNGASRHRSTRSTWRCSPTAPPPRAATVPSIAAMPRRPSSWSPRSTRIP